VVRLSSLSQRLTPIGTGSGQLSTELAWELSGPGCKPAAGRFGVEGSYKLNTKGDLELTHTE
jgi:hypothetical protein